MKTLYLHADTTGAPQWKLASTALMQPHMARLSVIVDGGDPTVFIIAPGEGWTYEPGSVVKHHITRDYAVTHGVDLAAVMAAIEQPLADADVLVGYAADFHRHVLERSGADIGKAFPETKARWQDAMRAAVPICKVPSMRPGGGYNFPKMAVAYEFFAGKRLILPDDPIAAGAVTIAAVRTIWIGIQEVNPAMRRERTDAPE